jgi:hypothetical protein
VGDAVGQPAVVRDDEQACGRGVEAASGYQARNVRNEVGDGRAATIIFHGGQISRRFVQGEVDVGFWKTDGMAIEFDLILGSYGRAEGRCLAVHPHAAGKYRRLGLAAGGCRSGAGEERLQTHYYGSACGAVVVDEVSRSRTRVSSS